MDHPNPVTSRSWHDWLEAHARRFLLFARSQARCEADAHDLLQDALVEVWRRCQGEPADHALVYKTIRRRAIDLARRIDRRERRELDAPLHWWTDRGDDDPAGLDTELAEAVKALPSHLRDVVTLKVWGELTFRQIADTLALPPATAASRYRYAIEHLRTALKEARVHD